MLQGSSRDHIFRRHHVVKIGRGVVVFSEVPGQFPLAVEVAKMECMHAKVLLKDRTNHTFALSQRILNGLLVLLHLAAPLTCVRERQNFSRALSKSEEHPMSRWGSGVGFSVSVNAVVFFHEPKQPLNSGVDLVGRGRRRNTMSGMSR